MPGQINALELMPGQINALELMPGQINALELMPGRIGQISALELMPSRIQSKMRQYMFTSTILHLLKNILLEKNQQSCTMKLKYI